MRRHLTVLLFSTMLAGPALAQATPPAGQPAQPQAQQETQKPMAATAQSGSVKFMQRQEANQWSADFLIGSTVYNSKDETLGEINDIIMDGNGRAVAAVIGVGGFLGIGEKDVAVDFSALDIQMSSDVGAAGGMAGAPADQARQKSAERPMPESRADGRASTTGQATPADNAAATDDDDIRIVLNVTKEQLNSAPEFEPNEAQD